MSSFYKERMDESLPSPAQIEKAIFQVMQKAPVAGVDGVQAYEYAGKEGELASILYQECVDEKYQPQPYLLLYFDKANKRRELKLPSFRDRVLMQTWLNEFSENLWNQLPQSAVGGRINIGHIKVLEQIKKALLERKWKKVIRLDLKNFYDTILHTLVEESLDKYLGARWSKQWVLKWLGTPAVFGGEIHLPKDEGIPTGLPISALLANLAMEHIDRWILKQDHIFYRRYYDDMLILYNDENCDEFVERLRLKLENVGLKINDSKTWIGEPHLSWGCLGHTWCEDGFIPMPPDPTDDKVRFVGSVGTSLCGQLLAKVLNDGLPTGDGGGVGKDDVVQLNKLIAIEVGASSATSKWYANCHLQKPLRTLYLQDQGSYLSLKRGHFILEKNNEVVKEIPFNRIGQIVAMGHINVSSGVHRACLKNKICFTYLSNQGSYYGRIEDPGIIRIRIERQQWRLLDDEPARLAIAKKMVEGRIANARTMLMRNLKGARKGEEIEAQLRPDLNILKNADSILGASKTIESLMGKEGQLSALLFKGYGLMWNSIGPFCFKNRNRRPPKDPINSMLSFGYTLLQYNIRSILELCGFNPRVGVYHSLRQGHASLASDLIEEFRAPIVESAIQVALGNKIFKKQDFTYAKNENQKVACLMTHEARRRFIEIFEMSIGRKIKHPSFGIKGDYRRMIHLQILHLAYVFETGTIYKAFKVR